MGLLPNLDGPISTLQAILILCAIVAFHELGHFTAARVQGIHVSKFAIGFGPSLWSYKAGDVEYSVRAFPLGGFVAFPDNDEDCPYPEDDPDLLKNRPIADRFWVISAGSSLITVTTPSPPHTRCLDRLPGSLQWWDVRHLYRSNFQCHPGFHGHGGTGKGHWVHADVLQPWSAGADRDAGLRSRALWHEAW